MNLLKICNRIIEYCFYALFLFVPLVFTSVTSELFELNKMWLTWGLTIVIGTSWFVKMILQRKLFLQRTPLDIPILLFLLSQVISTIFSQDVHVSLWGYYSRFNGGLLSIISYIFLYYAFVSNLTMDEAPIQNEGWRGWKGSRQRAANYPVRDTLGKHSREGNQRQDPERSTYAIKMVKRILFVSLISGTIVALWGLPSHFGYDPTCFLFRGTFDVSCWTADFQPRTRIFSTLGQPAWLAAYLAILLPISIIMFIKFIKNLPLSIFYFLLSALFYLDVLYTGARSGFLGVWISLIFFAGAYIFTKGKELKSSILNHKSLIIIGIFLVITFVIGTPINQLNKFTLHGIGSYFQKLAITPSNAPNAEGGPARSASASVAGGTESADIRLNVWTGAINAWKNNPILGTGVETFAFAYYKYKPANQNLTSEWNFLYNKAHNEYLNYLATTGILGLGTYLFMIGFFLFLSVRQISKSKFLISNQAPNSKSELGQLEIRSIRNFILPLLASYISILITNFFGFSVVITNIYLFMIPAFVFILGGVLNRGKQFAFPKNESGIKNYQSSATKISLYQWTFILFIIPTSLFMLSNLFRFWQADIEYALGYNLDRAGEYQKAYESLNKAVELRRDEPVFKDELSINNAIIAAGLLAQAGAQDQNTKDQTIALASALAQKAINTSNEIVSQYQHNAVFWKTRTRVFYTLSQVDSRYLPRALDAIEKGSLLAPNDANIWYNLGVLYGQSSKLEKGIQALEKTVKLKPDYRDAHYALGLYYHTASLDADGKLVVNDTLNQKAISEMRYILDYLSPNDAAAQESLRNWEK